MLPMFGVLFLSLITWYVLTAATAFLYFAYVNTKGGLESMIFVPLFAIVYGIIILCYDFYYYIAKYVIV